MNGYGEYSWPSGEVYKGNWSNDKRNGLGENILANGKKYKGEYKDGKNKDKVNFIRLMEKSSKVHGPMTKEMDKEKLY